MMQRYRSINCAILSLLACFFETVWGNNYGTSWRSSRAAATILYDGHLAAMGPPGSGGSPPEGIRDIKGVASTFHSYAVWCENGDVHTWGSSSHGGVKPSGLDNVKLIISSRSFFVALKYDGTTHCWGGGYDHEFMNVKHIVANAERSDAACDAFMQAFLIDSYLGRASM